MTDNSLGTATGVMRDAARKEEGPSAFAGRLAPATIRSQRSGRYTLVALGVSRPQPRDASPYSVIATSRRPAVGPGEGDCFAGPPPTKNAGRLASAGGVTVGEDNSACGRLDDTRGS